MIVNNNESMIEFKKEKDISDLIKTIGNLYQVLKDNEKIIDLPVLILKKQVILIKNNISTLSIIFLAILEIL